MKSIRLNWRLITQTVFHISAYITVCVCVNKKPVNWHYRQIKSCIRIFATGIFVLPTTKDSTVTLPQSIHQMNVTPKHFHLPVAFFRAAISSGANLCTVNSGFRNLRDYYTFSKSSLISGESVFSFVFLLYSPSLYKLDDTRWLL